MFNKLHILGALKSRTIHLNVYVIIAAAVVAYLFPNSSEYFNNVATVILAVTNIYMRSITAESLIEKGSK